MMSLVQLLFKLLKKENMKYTIPVIFSTILISIIGTSCLDLNRAPTKCPAGQTVRSCDVCLHVVASKLIPLYMKI
jgi:hypothetical protein